MKELVSQTIFSERNGPPGPIFPEKNGPSGPIFHEKNGPPRTNFP